MTRRYVHNVGADVPLLSYEGAALNLPSYLHADHQGSIVAISDPWGAGTVNSYDEYGIPGATNVGRFQYTGQIWIPELGMYHYKARIYSPTLGRFLQTDPIGYNDQFNLYAYVGNDPINLADPSGMTVSCSHGTCVVTANTYSAARSTHQTALATPEMKNAMNAQASIVRGNTEEVIGYGIGNNDGGFSVRTVPTDTTSNIFAATGQGEIPGNSAFGTHWHISSGDDASRGMVDSPEDNGGYGDTASLAFPNPIPFATVYKEEAGWHEIEDGQLRFTVPRSAISNPELQRVQRNLNIEQRRFQTPEQERRSRD